MLTLVLAAVQSILQVMAIVFFGFCLTKAGYFTTEKQKWLSKLNMVFFTPCLLFSNISSIISFQKLLEYWPIPLFYITFASLSFLSGKLAAWVFRLSPAYSRFVLACVMFSNTNSLPIAVIASLAVSEAGKILYWGADDTQASVAARGISYAMFFAIFGNLLRWSYGYNLLRSDDESEYDTVIAEYGYGSVSSDPERGPLEEPDIIARRSSSLTLAQDVHPHYVKGKRASTLSNRSDNTVRSDSPSHLDETSQLLSFPSLPCEEQEPETGWRANIKCLLAKIHSYMSPPLYAALLALIVGFIPPLKHLLYAKHGFVYPSFTSAIESCGKAAVPIILVCLGAQLTAISESSEAVNPASRKPIAIAITTRMCLAPLIIVPIVALFVVYCGHWATIAGDPVFSIMMIILGCTPTAINLVQISQVTGTFEDEMLRVLFWSYGVVCVPVFTLVVFVALNIVDKLV